MKKITLFLLFVLPVAIFAQNWKPVNPDYTYFYKNASGGLISNTVKVDSVTEPVGYPIFHLNTVTGLCDTCQEYLPTCTNIWLGYPVFFHRFAPNFLQKEVHQLNSGKYWFTDSASFVILSLSSLNQPWIYDTVNNITAQMINLAFADVFPGVADSTKTIALSDGNEIVLSKNYGIIKFQGSEQDYFLAGLITGTSGYGETPPGFWDYFDFNVGDVFQHFGNAGSAGYQQYTFYTLKIKITSKQQTENTVKFGRHVIRKSHTYGTVNISDDTVTYINNADNLVNQIPNNRFNICDDPNFDGFCEIWPADFYSKICLKDFMLSDGLRSISNYTEDEYGNLMGACTEDENLLFTLNDFYGMTYTEGLGQTRFDSGGFEYYDNWHIVGYIKNGDTTGSITPDEILLAIDEKFSDKTLQIFPNPATENLTFAFSANGNTNVSIAVFDLQGRLINTVFAGELIGEQKITRDLQNAFGQKVNPGVYFCRYTIGEAVGVKKIVVSR